MADKQGHVMWQRNRATRPVGGAARCPVHLVMLTCKTDNVHCVWGGGPGALLTDSTGNSAQSATTTPVVAILAATTEPVLATFEPPQSQF